MKVKLLIGFVQCVSFIPRTFGNVPWPANFVDLSRILNLASIDLFSAFGNLCEFYTSFYVRFTSQMLILPVVFAIISASFLVVLVMRCFCCCGRFKQTTSESVWTRFFELLFLVVYTLYTSVSTSIFRLFDCQEVQGKFYLTADFSVTCYEGMWSVFMFIAIAAIVVYTVGIPLVLYVLLRRNRSHLYAEGCPHEELSAHALVKRRLGAVYGAYNSHSYFYDLIDLMRRLLLTGGLIILGESSNVQIFLGGVVCLCWLCLVLAQRPYAAFWDNVLSGLLSFQLLLIILSGMALEIHGLTPSYDRNPYQRSAFGVVMVAASILVIVSALFAIFVSIPCIRERCSCIVGHGQSQKAQAQPGVNYTYCYSRRTWRWY